MSWHRGWMDGVPLELRPKYYPKPPLRFKDIDIYIPLDAIENDYDFTEERRVLAECKMWEEDKEKERQAEEERQRQRAEEAEKIRLESERLAIEELEKEANLSNLDEKINSFDQETLLTKDLNSKLILGDDIEYNKTEEADSSIAAAAAALLPNNYNNSSNNGSNQNSHHESPTSEESSISQPQPTFQPCCPTNVELEAIAGAAAATLPPIHHLPTLNGYQYMMNSDNNIQMPIYHQQTVPQYYNYYPPPIPTVVSPPVVTMPLQVNQHPVVSSRCPYPPAPTSWSQQNGHCAPPPIPIPVSNSGTVAASNNIVPPQPSQNSHIPSPTSQATEPQRQPQQQSNPNTTDSESNNDTDSFSKLHFPFLSSMAASRGSRDRDSGLGYLSSNYNRSYLPQSNNTPSQHPSTDDIASQNPFLSSFVQSHSPMHHHQYWPTSHLPPQQTSLQPQNPTSTHTTTATPIQNGPVHSAIGTSNYIANSPPSTAPTGSQHALL